MLRPEEIARPSPTGLLRSSFHLPSHLQEVSNMTTRANSQFPRPDFHRQDKQPYGLRTTVREWLLVRLLVQLEEVFAGAWPRIELVAAILDGFVGQHGEDGFGNAPVT